MKTTILTLAGRQIAQAALEDLKPALVRDWIGIKEPDVGWPLRLMKSPTASPPSIALPSNI